eukprot:1429915-Prymnesium_polylepis.1
MGTVAIPVLRDRLAMAVACVLDLGCHELRWWLRLGRAHARLPNLGPRRGARRHLLRCLRLAVDPSLLPIIFQTQLWHRRRGRWGRCSRAQGRGPVRVAQGNGAAATQPFDVLTGLQAVHVGSLKRVAVRNGHAWAWRRRWWRWRSSIGGLEVAFEPALYLGCIVGPLSDRNLSLQRLGALTVEERQLAALRIRQLAVETKQIDLFDGRAVMERS